MNNNNIFIPILTIAIITSGLASSEAFADDDPPGCAGNTLTTTLFRLPGVIDDGGQVQIIAGVSNLDVNGCDVQNFPVNLFPPAADGTASGAMIELCNPADAGAATPPNCFWDAGAGGTNVCYVSDAGNGALTALCPVGAAIIQNASLLVTVDVNDGVSPANFLLFGNNPTGLHQGPNEALVEINRGVNVQLQFPYDFTTETDFKDGVTEQDIPIRIVTDTITILGIDGTEGMFSAVATLYLEGVNVAIDDDDAMVDCQPPLLTTMTFDQDTTIVCTWDRTNGGSLAPGTYCWMVTVTDESGTYLPPIVSHNGCATIGDDPQDDANEQFTIGEFRGCTPGTRHAPLPLY